MPCFWLPWLCAAALFQAALVLRQAPKLQQLQPQILLQLFSHLRGPIQGQSRPLGVMQPQSVRPLKLLAVGRRTALLLPQSPVVLVSACELVHIAQACNWV